MSMALQVTNRPGAESNKPRGPVRNYTVDAIRGLLAFDVMLNHFCTQATGDRPWSLLGYSGFPFGTHRYAVWVFWLLSAYVLMRSWDGNFVAFLVRRFVRLWPLYAICATVGYLLLGRVPELPYYAYLPANGNFPLVNPPAWSLNVEWWVMLSMPMLARAARGSFIWTVMTVVTIFILTYWSHWLGICMFFMAIGAFLARYDMRCRLLETRVFIWLGAISYPLYLSHWFVLTFLPVPLPLKFGAALGLAQILTWTVEVWSIKWSRQAGARVAAALHQRHREGQFAANAAGRLI
jgi:peptidoglycan/LPS O-acetylase OafA/YrhL